jgi:hypothetical protein
MSEHDSGKLSTTRLAKLTNLDSRKLFERLLERQWLTREKGADGKSQYQLTAKGEFEGGEYRESDKFGRYIVWPASLANHRLLTDIEEKYLTATSLGRSADIPARLINLLLVDLGWIEAIASGWQLTSAGQALGGQAKETAQGATYVSWPVALADNKQWLEAMAQLQPSSNLAISLDGRPFSNDGLRLISNWLYLHRISYAAKRTLVLADSDTVVVDFYLPQVSLAIEYWGYGKGEAGADFLKQKVRSQELLKQAEVVLLELQQLDLSRLDEIMARALIRQGLRVY